MSQAQDSGLRTVVRTFEGVRTSDGAGVALTRVIGSQALDMLDPFLLLDEFRSDRPDDYIAGFPDHPHRGFETVTYLLAGKMRHQDNQGHAGVIEAGGVQWMTAGRGIVHSEMPEQEDGLLWGFQLWVNLPARQKWVAPGYQEFPSAAIPTEDRDAGVAIRVIAGSTSGGVSGPVIGVATEPLYLDVSVDAGATLREPVAPSHNAFVYAFEGRVVVRGGRSAADATVAAGALAVLGPGARVEIVGDGPHNRFLLIAGKQLREPVARAGPFVMNTRQEVMDAFQDYREGRF
ncbi:MAG: quercetin 2,3-dioxygenase [Gammaproteobacteria bacterium]|nr:quercetin 2,3-dioxygenase [Gammaproteobacteria bacterium]NIM73069.1 quercetin 2,3-dioxygenase [Gammaproteobacteria bacterium]NIN38686.1 quercetin 2,3-dioxygenase [Gammaproteobacteria bacterium]NIO24822.1 quercetin 2,3-dioxygenase [Gammaproteobacteria bacterium]NIO65425.1 quercetin 2,3-dioxygenase [Gammaproteobacteria bacterium]